MDCSVHVGDEEFIIRMTFSPESYKDGEFLPTAVSLQDLRDRGFSVDRESLTIKSAVLSRIDIQRQKKPDDRQFPLFSKLHSGAVRAEVDDAQQRMFVIEASPVEGNPGHAVIKSAREKGDSALRKMRSRLIKHLAQGIVAFETLGFPQG